MSLEGGGIEIGKDWLRRGGSGGFFELFGVGWRLGGGGFVF